MFSKHLVNMIMIMRSDFFHFLITYLVNRPILWLNSMYIFSVINSAQQKYNGCELARVANSVVVIDRVQHRSNLLNSAIASACTRMFSTPPFPCIRILFY